MMSITDFLGTIFQRFRMNGKAERARQAGREHAKVVLGNYLDGFDEQASEMLQARQHRLLGGPVVKSVRAKITGKK